jgi:alcohol dehydrogenase
MGHDPDVRLPHVPGHELAGEVEAVGKGVRHWRVGDRVTVPFAVGCGECGPCGEGHLHICDRGFQPGFTAWGSFAERVAIPHADLNLVRLPEDLDYVAAAGLGCRFTTSYRAVVQQGRVIPGEWVGVLGCGGVGLSAVMVAAAFGARVIAVDVRDDALALASEFGAEVCLNAGRTEDVSGAIREVSGGGAHVAIDALGSRVTCWNSVACLRKRGRQVQVGLLLGPDRNPSVPMHLVIAKELEIKGSHGLAAHGFPELLELVQSGRVDPRRLVRRTVELGEVPVVMEEMGEFRGVGITVVDRF